MLPLHRELPALGAIVLTFAQGAPSTGYYCVTFAQGAPSTGYYCVTFAQGGTIVLPLHRELPALGTIVLPLHRELPALGTIVFKLQKENNGRKKKEKFTEIGKHLQTCLAPTPLMSTNILEHPLLECAVSLLGVLSA